MIGKQVALMRGLSAMCLLASAAAFGASNEKAKVDGMIMTRTGETLIVNNSSGKTTVVLTATTVTKDDRGLFGLDKERLADTVLIPGLKVKVVQVFGLLRDSQR